MDVYSSKLSPALDVGVGLYLLVVAVFSIVGNLLVLIMAFKRSSSMKPPELLSVNLAVTDLGAAVTIYPLAVASAWNHHWLGGEATCVYYSFAEFFFGMVSIMSLTVLAIVRFIIISLNQQHSTEKISWKKVKILCLWTWLYGLLWALFPILGWGKYGPEPFGLSCSLAWGQMREEGFSFVFSVFVFNLLLPSVIIIFCYFGISLKLYLTYKYSVNHNHQIGNIMKMHRRVLTIAILISLGFIGCWAPYGIVSLWSIYNNSASLPPEVTVLPCMFAKSSTVYNPLIYYIFSKKFNREVKQLGWLCRGITICHKSNITDNGIYMISDQIKITRAAEVTSKGMRETERVAWVRDFNSS